MVCLWWFSFSGNKHIGLLFLQASAWHNASPSAVNLHRQYSLKVDTCNWRDSQSNSRNKNNKLSKNNWTAEGRQEDEKQMANWPSTKIHLSCQSHTRLTEPRPRTRHLKNKFRPTSPMGRAWSNHWSKSNWYFAFSPFWSSLVKSLGTVTKFIEKHINIYNTG